MTWMQSKGVCCVCFAVAEEKELGSISVVSMKSNQCILQHPSSFEKSDSRKLPKTFAFDNCFDCLEDPKVPTAQQEEVFSALGEDILNNAFEGYNACILAYGQTGSGKSYTMMGSADTRGLIPRLCDSLFERTSAANPDPGVTYKVEVSYMEIYNEKVHDLLDPKGSRQMLKVREHNILGPYVDGLSQLAVSAYEEIEQLIEEGNKARTVAATNMNSESSRSHAVFTVILTQTLTDHLSGVSGEKMSRISLVDLAGSERAVKTGAVGDRLKEGSNINKSLTTLGLVISKLADQSLGKGKLKDNFVPYRDSALTWLLKDNLGGNSRTVMVATVSPSSDNYEETLSTLRYADRAKRIVNHAVVNEDPKAKIIRELRQEVEALREQLKANLSLKQGKGSSLEEESINEKLHASEKLITNLSETWENKLKKTERMQQERQQALEKMGISVQASGISVEKNKYYLVNLNADPCLNENLVYYLKDRTLVGRPDVKGVSNDIHLFGVGIETHHCTLVIQNKELFLEPTSSARTFVNGSQVTETIQLRHGDRILWGFNYFFRVNCPRSSIGGGSEPQTPAQPIDYNFAREELMLKELNNDPIQAAIQNLERQHEEDKQMALEKQRLEYEKQFQQLRNILSPTTPYGPYQLFDPIRGNKMTPSTPTSQLKIEKWAQEREDIFKRSLAQLRQDIMKANTLVKEANFFAQEMGKHTTFQVTLQIPPQNLSPNRKRSAFVSEPAILVKRKGKPSQVWSMEKLDHKLIVMREMYNDTRNDPSGIKPEADPFYESQETHNLIGVANVFLGCLFHDVRLNYHIPIISQQGEVAGRLQVEISRVAGQFPQERFADTLSDSSGESGMSRDEDDFQQSSTVTCRVCIKQASGLPPSLSHFVFCQYQFWGQTEGEVVAPVVNNDYPPSSNANDSVAFKFEHAKNYVTSVSEDFIEHCSEGALSIEVWGHRSAGFGIAKPGWEVDHQLAKARSLIDRWKELTRKIEFWVEIQELGECGEYVSVEVTPQKDCLTGGVYQLRQGQQRRVVCRVKPVANSGTLPLICEAITSINIGSICGRIQCQRQLDSYTEEDLNVLREKWSDALQRRRMYLDQQIQKIINKDNKSERDSEREQSLVDQWVSLTEERNAVLVPAPGSNVPGAPADWDPPSGMEVHVPVVFLDLNADDFSAQCNGDLLPCAGTNAIIPKENCNKFFPLQIIKCYEKDVCAVASWDSSIHDNIHLNRITQSDERVYLVIKAVVRLSHPAPMDIVLRKRISVNIYKKQSFTSKLVKSFIGSYNTLYDSGVMYEVVSNIPKASEELEDRESLAKMAANADDCNEEEGETYIEKYTKGVTSVESILMLDRLRQSVAVKELLQTSGRPLMRKTASVPNFSQLFGSFDEGLDVVARSGSVMDLNAQLNSATTPQATTPQEKLKHRYPLQGPSRPTFLNLNVNLNTLRQQGPTCKSSASPSPGPVKMAPRMTTLHEESHPRDSDLVYHMEEDEEEEEDDVGEEEIEERNSEINDEEFYCEMSNYRRVGSLPGNRLQLTQSRTLDSLNEVAVMKAGTPSTVSSGYGSGAVSSTTLSEDSMSIRSVSVDETPEKDMPILPLTSSDLPLTISDLSVISSGESDSSDTKTVINQNLETLHISEEENSTPEAIKETVSSAESPDNKGTSSRSIEVNHSDVASKESNNNKICSEFPSSNSLSPLISTNEVIKRTVKGNNNTHHRRSVPSFNSPSMVNGISNGNQSVTSPLTASSNKATSSNNAPDWCVIGESIQLRPTNYSGIISYIGPTDFAIGTWIGVELDLPMGKHDGSIDGVRYFTCRPKCGMFVRPDKLILDRRGRAMRNSKNVSSSSQGSSSGHMKRSRSTADRLSDVGAVRNANKSDVTSSMRRSKSRGEGLSSLSTERSRSINARYRKV